MASNSNSNTQTPMITAQWIKGALVDKVTWLDGYGGEEKLRKDLETQQVVRVAEVTSAPDAMWKDFKVPWGIVGLLQKAAAPPPVQGNFGAVVEQPSGTDPGQVATLQDMMDAIKNCLESTTPISRRLVVEDANDLLPVFVPASGHPFADYIAKAKIPALPDRTKPDLLLHGLPVRAPETTSVSMDVDIEGDGPVPSIAESQERDSLFYKALGLRVPTRLLLKMRDDFMVQHNGCLATLIGVSGCGKTRTIMETLSARFGLYFIVSTGGNGGSRDMERMLTDLDEALRKGTDNESIGKHYLQALLLSRLLALHYVITHAPESHAHLPYLWALFQYRPGLTLPTNTGTEVFTMLYSRVVQYSSKSIEDALASLLEHIYKKIGLVYVVSDESQLLFERCVGKFTGITHFEQRSVFSKLVPIWTASTQTLLVLAGTGLRLRKSLKFAASGMLKPEAELEKYTIVDFGLFDTVEEMQEYLLCYFPSSPNMIREIFSYLKGRRRTAAFFATRILSSTKQFDSPDALLRSVLDEVVSFATSCENQRDKQSMQNSLWELYNEKRPAFIGKAQSNLEIIYRLTTSYYLFGGTFTFESREVLSLVAQGLCPIARNDTGALSGCIAEPLVAWASYLFFASAGRPVEDAIKGYMSTTKLNPTASGLFVEHYLIPSVLKYFSKEGFTLDKTSYFQRNFCINIEKKEFPEWLIGATLHTPNYGANMKANWVGYAGMGITFDSYLEDPTVDVFVPSSIVRKDAICRVQSAKSEEHLAFMEWKFRQSITSTVATEAIYTTSYSSIYTNRDRSLRPEHSNKRRRTMQTIETKYNGKNGCLRIVFLYPEAPKDITPQIIDNDVIIILDKRYSEDLFDLDTWKFLDSLKAAIPSPSKKKPIKK